MLIQIKLLVTLPCSIISFFFLFIVIIYFECIDIDVITSSYYLFAMKKMHLILSSLEIKITVTMTIVILQNTQSSNQSLGFHNRMRDPLCNLDRI